jgi:hypothetical protein
MMDMGRHSAQSSAQFVAADAPGTYRNPVVSSAEIRY